MKEWIRDIHVENTPLSTTGGHTWNAAYRLADYLAATAQELGLHTPGARILELGSGCGWLGITVARNLTETAFLVCLTEQENGGACEWLQHNVKLNRSRGLPLDAIRVRPLDWLRYSPSSSGRNVTHGSEVVETSGGVAGLEPDLQQQEDNSSVNRSVHNSNDDTAPLDVDTMEWDFIIGSDLIYNQIGSRCLPQVMASLASPSTKILYCHTKHRYDLLDVEFFNELEAVGLRWKEVWEPGAPAPPRSPPVQFPPADLFPEQRIAIFLITKQP